jgi:hypothetical protein
MESIQAYKTVSHCLIPDVSEIVCKYLYHKRTHDVLYILRKADYETQSTHTVDIGFYSVKEDAIDHLLKRVNKRKNNVLNKNIRDCFKTYDDFHYHPGNCYYSIIKKDLSTSNKRRKKLRELNKA